MMTDTRDEQDEVGSGADASPPVRYPTAIALGGGLAAAVGSSFIPMNAIEGFVTAYGISELLPAAAPPLGDTARLALSAGIGTLTAGALLALLPRAENTSMGFETAVEKDTVQTVDGQGSAPAASGFGASRFAGWVRTLRFGKTEAAEGEITGFGELNRLRIRNGDQHPDAPVRTPIMASSDLGASLDTLPDIETEAETELQGDIEIQAEIATPTEIEAPGAFGHVAPITPDAEPFALDGSMAWAPPEPVEPDAAPTLRFAPSPEQTPVAQDEPEFDAETAALGDTPIEHSETLAEPIGEAQFIKAAPTGDLSGLDIPALLDRLESGLVGRRTQAGDFTSGQAIATQAAGRFVPLTVAPNLPTGETDAPAPLRFRLGNPVTEQSMDIPAGAASIISSLEPDIETVRDEAPVYLAPGFGQTDNAGVTAGGEGAVDTSEPAQAAPDEDMDAALRDALATLRQLSDRQRNV